MTVGPSHLLNIPLDLARGIDALGLRVTEAQQLQLLSYMDLIQKWNKVYNLTALRDPADMLTHHLLDSLTAIAPLSRHTQGQPTKVLDVGSGAGLPGVVIAIACPHIQVTCIDAVSKKSAFVQQVAASLGLAHLRGLHQRIEQLDAPHDLVCSRAFASLADFVQGSANALAPGGVWLALKGKTPTEEMSALGPDVDVFHVEQLLVPGLNAQRCLVWMRPAAIP